VRRETFPGSAISLAVSLNGCHSKRHAGNHQVSDWFTMPSVSPVETEGAGLLSECVGRLTAASRK